MVPARSALVFAALGLPLLAAVDVVSEGDDEAHVVLTHESVDGLLGYAAENPDELKVVVRPGE